MFCYWYGFSQTHCLTDRGPKNIKVDNVQHIPGFHVNIIAYKAFRIGGAYLDGKSNWIRRVNDDRCVAICENSACGSFLVLEKNKTQRPNIMSFATNSKQKLSTATAENMASKIRAYGVREHHSVAEQCRWC